ncbi:helix-turn-helix domain-containing protein [Desulfatirhabdium butyrativorans]|uniref:helix-turn-helix transcriptional regulator n=1 Tax=Desulfatirhabdium butyrativorans TaxID=340467 RepID=UPI00048130BF
MSDIINGWAKPKQAARYAGVSVESIRQWMQDGLPYASVSSRLVLIRISDIDAFLEKRIRKTNDIAMALDQMVSSITDSIRGNRDGRQNQGKNKRKR